MSDKPKDCGAPKPQATPTKAGTRIPQSLQGVFNCFTSDGADGSGWGYENSVKRYGLWLVRAVRPCAFFHQSLQVGDTVRIPGNLAVESALAGSVDLLTRVWRRRIASFPKPPSSA
jgi:hypothetical protein